MKRGRTFNRGQITIFIILGIVIVIGIVVYFFMIQNNISAVVDPAVEPLYDHIQDCLKETTVRAINHVSIVGGFSQPSLESGIAIYYDRGKNYFPQKESLEEDINEVIDGTLDFCMDFSQFSDYVVEKGRITVDSEIVMDSVIVDINYPLVITQGTSHYQFEHFQATIPSRMDLFYNVIAEINQEQTLHPESLCLSCVYDLALEHDLTSDITRFEDGTVVIGLTDKKNSGHVYNFAHIYELKNETAL